jgi:glycopeptide antibiotics resistance protein
MRRLRTVALVAAVAFIAVLTLTPGSPVPYLYLAEVVSPWVGSSALALALNVLLFVPLGAVIAWFGRPWLLLGALGASVAIELTQFLLPGRNPLLIDVVTNTLGACLGYVAVIAYRHLASRRARRRAEQQGHRQQLRR